MVQIIAEKVQTSRLFPVRPMLCCVVLRGSILLIVFSISFMI